LTDFRKITHNIKFLLKSVQWEPSRAMRTDRRTGITKLLVAFRDSAKRA